MDSLFLQGVVVAFLIGVVKVGISISLLLSQRARNLKRIGLYYSLMHGTFTSNKPVTVVKLIVFAVYLCALTSIFSWLSVASAAWGFISSYVNRAPVPEKVKEIQYKIAHLDLTREQLIELQEELSRILNLPLPIKTGEQDAALEEEDQNTYVLDSSDWYHEVTIQPMAKTMMFYGHTPDYDSVFHSSYEYRFNGDILEARLIESVTEHYNEKNWHVKDGVVLESEIRKQCEGGSLKSFDEELARYKAEVEWGEYKRPNVRYFAMSKHSEIFPRSEFRRILRSDLERLRTSKDQALKIATELGLRVTNTDEGYEVLYPSSCTSDEKDRLGEQLRAELSKSGTDLDALYDIARRESDLLRFLGEKAAA